MLIKSVRIENFRSFKDETISLDVYNCFAGPNGAGKSTVLAALNVFFQEKASAPTDITRLESEDYFHRNTKEAAKITITFDSLPDEATKEFSDYLSGAELRIEARAVYNPETRVSTLSYYGWKSTVEAFMEYFESEQSGGKVSELKSIFQKLSDQYSDLGRQNK